MLAMDAIESFHVINLGCKVNKVESDGYSMQLLGFGLFQAPLEDAHLVVINTCAVTAEAEKKTRKTVRHAVASNNHARVVVTGCSSALHPEEYEAISPRVTVVSKPESTLFFNKMFPSCGHEAVISVPVGGGFRSRVGVKVQDGCNNECTYCIVHVARGKAYSRNANEIIKEVVAYAQAGVREIVLTGINLGTYEGELNGQVLDLAALLQHMINATASFADKDNLVRFRISSIEPMNVSESLMDMIAAHPHRICRHLHLPLQAGSSKVLKEMNRPYSAEQFQDLVKRLRDKIPGLSLSTDIIVGFPGETDAEFQETCAVARSCAFSKIHVFPYSIRQGTPAAIRIDQVDSTLKHERARVLRQLGQELARQDFQSRSGTWEYALVESDGTWMTESYHSVDAPTAAPQGTLVKYTFS